MKRFLRWLLGVETEVVPVLMVRGEEIKLLTREELDAIKKRWALTLRGRSQDLGVKAILEMIEFRITQASAVAQNRNNHGSNAALVHYDNGEAAGLNDLLLDLVRMLHAREQPEG
jgi:hypothetical protein